MTVKVMAIAELVEAPYNPREMPETEMEMLKDSLLYFGHAGVIVVNDYNNHIVGGNQTIKAMNELKEEYKDVVENPDYWRERAARDKDIEDRMNRLINLANDTEDFTIIDAKTLLLDDEEEQTLNIALNQIHGLWNYTQLNDIIESLELKGFNTKLTGFNVELNKLETEPPKKLKTETKPKPKPKEKQVPKSQDGSKDHQNKTDKEDEDYIISFDTTQKQYETIEEAIKLYQTQHDTTNRAETLTGISKAYIDFK